MPRRIGTVFALLAAFVIAPALIAHADQTTAASVAQSQAELEQLAARLPITLDTKGVYTPLTIDPYAAEDPVEVWNDWRMQNQRDREPPLLVIVAHNMWAYLHGVPTDAESNRVVSEPVAPANEAFTSESLLAAIINIAPAEPVPGEDAETFISADPNNPQHIVISCNHRLLYDSTCTSTLTAGSGVTLNSNGGQELYWSTDGGATWSRQCAPWHSGGAYTLTSSNGTSPFTFQSSDPSIAWDTYGNAYVFTLPWWQDASGTYSGNSVNVVKWDVTTNTWSAISTPETYVSCATYPCDTLDKTEGAIDRTSGQTYSHTNRMYFAWTHIYYTTSWRYRLRIAYSDPPYTTWTKADLAPGGTIDTGNSYTRLSSSFAVAADGTVYLAWDRDAATGSAQRISKSTDGGATWSAFVAMSTTAVLTDFATNTKIAAQDTRGIALLPQIGVDACATSPYKGYLYEAYTDYHTGVTSGNDVDVYVKRSTNGGTTWTTVATFAGVASGTSQFEPTTAVDQSTGVVTVAWYDTSIDPTNNRQTQVYVSQSSDGGATWSAQQVATDAGGNFSHHYNYMDENSTDMPSVTTLHHYQYGEYMGATSSGGKLFVAWTDSRNWLTENSGDTEYEDIGVGYPCNPPAAPAASIAVPQNNRIDVSWTDSSSPSVTQYLVSRSTISGGPYTLIATIADSSPGVGGGPSYLYHDDTVSGGTTYYYVVVATDGTCPSAKSNEVAAVATGACALPPTFAGLASVTNPGASTCTLNLAWNAGASNCAAGLTYNVYRSTSSGFTPGPANQIATGVAGTSYIDAIGISGGTTYYYVVRAVDVSNSVEDSNTVQKSGSPTGPITSSNYTDTFEGSLSGGGFDLPGWTHGIVSGSTDWAWSTTYVHDGTHSWFASDVAGPDDKVLVSPSFGVIAGTTLTFWHTYAFEGSVSSCYDAGTLEYTTNGGTSWTVVPAADFTSGGYTGTAGSSFSNPIGGDAAWCGGTVGTMTQVAVNLGGDANLLGRTVQIRWHEGDDSSLGATGWYVDTVTVNNAGIAGACTPGSANNNADVMVTKSGAPASVATNQDVTYTVTVTNNGPDPAATVQLNDPTPTNTTFRSITAPAGWTCSTPAVGGTGAISCSVATLAASAPASFTIVVRVNYCAGNGSLSNTATVSSSTTDPNTTNNTASASTTVTDSGACDDGNPCTQTDTCQSGVCVGSNPVVCTALDQCHVAGVCDTGTGQCSNPNAPNGTTCDDGNGCTQTDACLSGVCTGSNPVVCTALDQCHVAGACDPQSGQCSNPNAPNGTTCNDGDACTQTDTCQSGVCTGSNPVVCTALDQCHVAGACDPQSGQCSNPNAPNGTTCNDGNACTQTDTCQSGVCTGGNPVVCTALDQCHVAGVCNTSTGVCTNPLAPNGTDCSDGDACTRTDWCVSGVCAGFDPITCTALDQCHVAGACDPQSGECSNPNAPNGTTCNDGNACTQTDACQAGACVGGNPVVCTALDQCHVAGTCDTQSGQCSNPNAPNGTTCNDSNACTQTDACQAGACVGANPVVCTALDQCHVAGECDTGTGLCSNPNAPNGTTCNDGDACTQTDACQAGACVGGNPVVCTALDQCHVVGACDPQSGQCSNPNAPNGTTCNDSNACTQTDTCQAGACVGGNPVVCTALDQCHVAGQCDTGTGLCSNPNAPNGTTCNDSNACTQADTCQAGACVGGNPVVCTALDQCHVAGECDSGTGLCSNPNAPNGTTCNDSDACTQTDTCQAGACVGGNPVVCTALDQCHVAGQCDTGTGLCSNPNAPNGTTCNDSNACTQTDTCQAGACVGGNPVVCTALDQCHVAGQCDTGTGLCPNPNAPNGTTCNDSNACTQTDTCQAGACVGGNPVICTALDQCHIPGVCNQTTGACSNPTAPNGTTCDDGNPCTSGDLCTAGACSGAPVGPPAEVNESLMVSATGSVATISWSDGPGLFDVYRGLVSGSAAWLYNQTCFASGTAGPATDGTLPTAGDSWFYLVTRKTVCGESIPGRDSGGTPIPNASPCP